ncbi:hypothetical protein ACLMJK_004513 [Lecanora helva]
MDFQWDHQGIGCKLEYDVEKYLTIVFQQDSTIKELVQKIKNLSWIEHLDLDLYLAVLSPMHPYLSNRNANDLKTRRELWRKGDINVANLVLSREMLKPLREVVNVGSWCIELTVMDKSDGETWFAHERMKLDLKGAMETKLPTQQHIHGLE